MNETEFIQEKIREVEKSIKDREQMAKTFRSGTDESWKQANKLNPNKESSPMKKADRIAAAQSQDRILVKLWQELKMYDAVLTKLNAA